MAEITMLEESGTPLTPGANKWKFYFKADGLYITDDAGVAIGPIAGVNSLYAISTSVSSNNLTVTISGSVYPVKFSIGGTLYSLTGSTSFTKNAGTNWCNAGSSEIKTLEVDYFVYAIGETGASAGLKFGFSRIPYASTMGDFVNTSTNEKYIAGNYTNFNATDAVTLIGRFNAVNSGSASYNWSVPATSIIINRPIYETRWLDWTPTLVGFSANPTNVSYRYKFAYDTAKIVLRQSTAGTSNATTFSISLPYTAATVTSNVFSNQGTGNDNGAALTTPIYAVISSGGSVINLYKDCAAATWTNANGKSCRSLQLFYELA